MGNYIFYTPPMLADYLLKLIPNRNYNNIIDICCGSWNLLHAAKKRYPNANFVGVDVDKNAAGGCIQGADFFCGDGRTFALVEKRKYDLVLSNPPFRYLTEDEQVYNNQIINSSFIHGLVNKRYENEMMQANLLLAEENGVLLFIMPTTFVEGTTYLSIRKELCERYTVDTVMKLPLGTFGSQNISTVALIIINNGGQKTSARYMNVFFEHGNWYSQNIGDISIDDMKQGVWKTGYIRDTKQKANVRNIEMFRGNISSSHMSKTGTKIFHSSSLVRDGKWKPSIRYCDDQEQIKKSRIVYPGDIIINRIGKCAKYWCVNKEKCIISDCLIAIRKSNKVDVYAQLMKNSKNGQLDISTKGVAAKYITMKDILELL